jgi:mannose-6-phosphate isomerase-like protein (cupin superfamily)
LVSFTTPVSDFEGERNPQNGALYVPAGTGVTKWVAGDVYTVKVSATTTNGSFGFIEASVPPGGGPPAHVHRRTDEAFYLVSGELEFLDGDRTYTARSGDFIFVPRGNRHRFTNAGLHTAKLLFMYTRGGVEELFVQGGDEPQPGVATPAWDMKRFEQTLGVIDRFDLDITMEPELPQSTT